MVGLEVRFELGRYHATPWGAHVNDAAVEWPPSPWRLVRALYSASRTNTQMIGLLAAVDQALQALIDAPPPVYQLPSALPGHTRHYMPKASYSPLATSETAKVIDAYLAISPATPLRAWWNADLGTGAMEALSAAARSVGYLGRSEAICSITVTTGVGPPKVPLVEPFVAGDTEHEPQLVELLCPEPGQPLDTIAVSVTELRSKRRVVPPGTRRIAYALPSEPTNASPPYAGAGSPLPTLAMYRLRGGSRPAVTEAVAVGQAVRSALQSRFGKRQRGSASETFSGRAADRPRADQHRHAHFLATSDGDGRRIDRLYVWAPEGFGRDEVEALAGLSFIRLHEVPDLQCALASLGTDTELSLPGLLGPASAWRSLTPFGLVRHPKYRNGEVTDAPEDQIRSELKYRGFPVPVEVAMEKGSWHRFRGSRAGSSRLERARLVGVRLRFDRQVTGPVALGALSHYGLGLMQPDG